MSSQGQPWYVNEPWYRVVRPWIPLAVLFGASEASNTLAISNMQRMQRMRLEREKFELEKKLFEQRRKIAELRAKNRFIPASDYSYLLQFPPVEVDLKKDVAFIRQGPNFIYSRGGRYLYDYYRRFPEWHQYVRLSRLPDWKELIEWEQP
ncbi:MAG: hypothetical protein QW542_06690 [Thermoproteota archaeon]